LRHRLGDGVEDRNALDVLAALARRDAGDDVRPVGAIPETVEAPFAAGQALHHEARVAVDDDRHYLWLFRAFRTIERKSSRPSSISPASSPRMPAAVSAGVSTRSSQASTLWRRGKCSTCSTSKPDSVTIPFHSSSE